jgi:hypothetical protein
MWSGCVDGRKDLYGFSLDVIMGPPEAVDMHVDAASSGGIGAILTQPNAVSAAAPVLSQALALLEASVQSEEKDLWKWDLNGDDRRVGLSDFSRGQRPTYKEPSITASLLAPVLVLTVV